MQKIYIHNFGAVKEAEIEINRNLILTGDQASGKSSVAKLIYFFKSLKDVLFDQIYQNTDRTHFNVVEELIFPIRNKFYEYFGSTFHLPPFEIKYCYDTEENKTLKLTLNESKKLHAEFNQEFFYQIHNTANEIRDLRKMAFQRQITGDNLHNLIAAEATKLENIKKISTTVNDLFESNHTDSLFVVPGRSNTLSFTELFEKSFYTALKTNIEPGGTRRPFINKVRTVDEILMLEFIDRVMKIKDYFRKYRDFEGLANNLDLNEDQKDVLASAKEKIYSILKGGYKIDGWGEKIVLSAPDETPEPGQYIYLHNASSAQKEVIRILQDLYLAMINGQSALRIIEDIEAQLSPQSQRELIELIFMFNNFVKDSQVIITTHSPYVLKMLNNLLIASSIVIDNPDAENEVGKIIDAKALINPDDFSAYYFGDNGNGEYCVSIIDREKGEIRNEYIDTIAEMLEADYKDLESLKSESMW